MSASTIEQTPFGVIIGGPQALHKRIEHGVILGSLLLGCAAAGYWYFGLGKPLTWVDVTSFLIGYTIINIGVGMVLHRYFSHKSYETYTWMRYVLGAMATMACQGSILKWAADHRRHHSHTDECGDLHSPHVDGHCHDTDTLAGMFHSHIGWAFDDTTTDTAIYGKGLIGDPVVEFFGRTRWFWYAASVAIFPGLYGYLLGGFDGMVGSILFGGFVRTFVLLNAVLAVNSIGHKWGSERYGQDNHSKNNFWLALLTFGDGFHNNHHHFPRAAMAGHRWWEIDVNGWIIHGMGKIGLAWNVVSVPESMRHPERFPVSQDNKAPETKAVA
jgi:stearoyl-CoA desaturase (delta-9 desaturase)